MHRAGTGLAGSHDDWDTFVGTLTHRLGVTADQIIAHHAGIRGVGGTAWRGCSPLLSSTATAATTFLSYSCAVQEHFFVVSITGSHHELSAAGCGGTHRSEGPLIPVCRAAPVRPQTRL
jgi:hypothetical protein